MEPLLEGNDDSWMRLAPWPKQARQSLIDVWVLEGKA
jgi:hypothetical protein